MKTIKKKQGRKKNGKKLTYAQNIQMTSGLRFKDAATYNIINKVNKCDYPNKILTISIIENKCTPNAANTFLKLQKFDKHLKLGYSEKVESGELLVGEANKLIKKFCMILQWKLLALEMKISKSTLIKRLNISYIRVYIVLWTSILEVGDEGIFRQEVNVLQLRVS